MAKTIRGRLDSLARAHLLITPGLVDPDKPRHATTLGELLRTVLSPYTDPDNADEDSRAEFEGPDLPISGEAVTSLALVFHELATNATKYGAFSAPSGRLRVDWSLAEQRLALSWCERGGPALKGEPAHEGFGSLLVRRSITGQLDGEIAYQWKPEGLTVNFSAAAERLIP
jgi:two-component system CheB/CheR fusion protein